MNKIFSLSSELKEIYVLFYEQIEKRLLDFQKVKDENIFYEFCFCILTPQSSAENAWIVQDILKEKNFLYKKFNPVKILSNKKNYIRFHNVKTKRLLNSIEYYPTLINLLDNEKDAFTIRKKIVCDFSGIGMKEASHFLRNIGFKNLAILDRHIIENLYNCGVIDTCITPKNERKYLEIEKNMRQFAKQINIDMDFLDLLFFAKSTGKVLK